MFYINDVIQTVENKTGVILAPKKLKSMKLFHVEKMHIDKEIFDEYINEIKSNEDKIKITYFDIKLFFIITEIMISNLRKRKPFKVFHVDVIFDKNESESNIQINFYKFKRVPNKIGD